MRQRDGSFGWVQAAAVLAAALAFGAPAGAEVRQTSAGPVEMTRMVGDLVTPWALAFLPGGGLLVTERDGELLHIRSDGSRVSVAGVPEVAARGQGGLLDVMLPRDFATSRELFLTFSKPQRGGAGTALASARLSADGTALEGLRVLFELAPGSSGGRHFGSRVIEGADGLLYMTIGDRGDDDSAQDRSRQNGSVIRLNRDGSVPADNPFAGEAGMAPEIWTWGHRNPQGAALDAEGQLWTVEHGARGGDEVNRIVAGTNYGWPVISYGRQYSGGRIGEGTEKAGMAQPLHYWDPSIAPSGLVIYSGRLFPEWEGDMFTGSLNSDLISRLDVEGARVAEAERIETPETHRVRDIREAPDGAIWFIAEGDGAIWRMTPAD